MLRGSYTATVDSKGRLKIPAAFKSLIDEKYGPEFYITSLNGQSARIYPLAEWRKIEEKLATLPSMTPAKRKLLDRTNLWGQMARMDTQGRVLIPAQLRDAAAVRGEVKVLGYLDYLDVWNSDRFREHLEQDPLTGEDLETLSGLKI
ncbi:MAG: division/cell wall cluster transcriptional repressor MraZ [Acidobacteriota bacterium]|nr:division/cell wall cluster transcriptional repressor MraZ [Acidobacteriota bacterium]